MQIKIVIGTVAFMLAMMVLGYSALREPSRMDRYSGAQMGRSIEAGAEIFANNCATCHGPDATAQNCVDSNGNSIGCQGLPLNNNALLCGDKSQRMTDMGWTGTKADYILTTVSAGRGAMPTWLDQFGGPMRPDQVQDVANFVLNFESETLCAAPVITYDWPENVTDFLSGPDVTGPGDPARGQDLYENLYACTACHGTIDQSKPALIGPALHDIKDVGATRVDGMDAEQYVYHSILFPSDFIAPDCPSGPCTGPPSAMLANFGSRMAENPQDMADLLAYLLSN